MSFFAAIVVLWTSLPALAGTLLVAMPPLTGDGETVATVQLWVDSGARVRPHAEEGRIGAVRYEAGGVVSFAYTPPAVTEPRTVTLRVTGGGEKTTIELALVPPFAGGLGLSLEADARGRRQLRIRPLSQTPVRRDARRFFAASSVGTMSSPVPAGDGTWLSAWSPPSTGTPAQVLFAAADAAAPDRIWGWASASGDGAPAAQLLFVPMPPRLPADAGLTLPVRLLSLSATGELELVRAPTLTASSGSIDPANAEKAAWQALVHPAPSPGELTLTAVVGEARAQARVTLVPALPTVTLVADPPTHGKSTKSIKLTAQVKDPSGVALPGRAPAFEALGASTSSSARDGGDGTYSGSWRLAKGATEARFLARPTVDLSALSVAHLLAWTSDASVPADGKSTLDVLVVGVDAYGLPVPNVDLRLAAPRGDGGVAPGARTDARGIAKVRYGAGTTPGLGTIRIEGAGLVSEVPVWQTSVAPAPALTSPGDPAWSRLLSRWRAAMPTLRVGPEPEVVAAGPAFDPQPTRSFRRPAGVPPARTGATANARAALTLALTTGQGEQDSNGGGHLLDDVDIAEHGAAGVELDGTWYGMRVGSGRVGVAGALRHLFDEVDTEAVQGAAGQTDFGVEAVYRHPVVGPVDMQAGLGLHVANAWLFRYADTTDAEAALLAYPLAGVRVSVAGIYEAGDDWLSLELSERFLPFPVATEAVLAYDRRLFSALTLRGALGLEGRSLAFEADEDGEARVTTARTWFRLGVGAAW